GFLEELFCLGVLILGEVANREVLEYGEIGLGFHYNFSGFKPQGVISTFAHQHLPENLLGKRNVFWVGTEPGLELLLDASAVHRDTQSYENIIDLLLVGLVAIDRLTFGLGLL